MTVTRARARKPVSLRAIGREGFFADKDRAFWLLQIGGWTGYFILRALGGLANNMGVGFVLPTAIITITGFSLTLLMAAAYRRVIEMRVVFVWTLTLLIIVSAAALFSVLEVWATATFYRPGWQPVGMEFFGGILLDLSVLGAWTGLYYGVNYYLMLSAQAHAMDRVTAVANEAQLTMLRYQLNPHFLFNTLNSISTLVLLKQTERANAMLSRLSSFLRYSLGEAKQMVPVAQEIEALKLYLDIEKMRFDERLRVTFHVEPPAHVALVPSLLLQPLVENAGQICRHADGGRGRHPGKRAPEGGARVDHDRGYRAGAGRSLGGAGRGGGAGQYPRAARADIWRGPKAGTQSEPSAWSDG